MRGFSRIAEQLLASQEGHCSTDLFTHLFRYTIAFYLKKHTKHMNYTVWYKLCILLFMPNFINEEGVGNFAIYV
jgi:hypothetical protein